MAFCFRIDTLDLINQLSISSEARSHLVQAADSTLKRAEETIAPSEEKRALASFSLRETTADSTMKALSEEAELKDIPENLLSRLEGDRWLSEKLGGSENLNRITDLYHAKFKEAAKDWIGELEKSTSEIQDDLKKTKLTIISLLLPNWRSMDWKRLEGMLISALLLSLGAPFWFNTLRSIANLRPQVAEKVEQSDKAGEGQKK